MSGIERFSEGANAVVENEAAGIRYIKGWDKYGRRVQRVDYADGRSRGNGSRSIGMIVRMPKPAIKIHPDRVYLVNDWQQAPGEGITYHKTLRQAREQAAENANR